MHMPFRFATLYTLVLLITTVANAAVINGKIETPNVTVRVLKYVDFINNTQLQIVEIVADKDGSFHITIPAGEGEKYKIFAGEIAADLFLTKTSIVSLRQKGTQLLVNDGQNGINSRFDSLFAACAIWNKGNEVPGITIEESLRELRKLEIGFLDNRDTHWNRMLRYYVAWNELHFTTQKRIKADLVGAVQAFDELEQKMLVNNRISTDNQFYITFFKDYIYSRTSLTPFRRTQGGMAAFSKVIREANYFKNDSLKEIAIVLGVKELYDRKWYGKSNSISELDDSVQNLAPRMKIPYFQKALLGTSDFNHRLKRGDNFPIITLKDAARKEADISQPNSEYTLVSFWATWCGPCRMSMSHYEALQQKFGNKLSIISISVDKQFETMRSYLEISNYMGKWLALHNGEKGYYLDALKIKEYPTYYLLDRNKKFIMSPEWDELEETLTNIIK